jgi:cation diffusion facilitator CzcD-associated flavoprotein CzcO
MGYVQPGAFMEHVDEVIVGAGLAGIGAAYRLRAGRPHDRIVVLEGRQELGGTWSIFSYPGVRSDSDMFTLSYPFRPWTHPASIAHGADILRYLEDTARDTRVDGLIRYGSSVTSASWSRATARWTLSIENPDGVLRTMSCRFLYLCTGYYSYESGYAPEFPGSAAFAGRIVHPQQWPPDLDVAGRRVVVIGSGATAVSLVPALASSAASVTMLQRSPTWIVGQPSHDALADLARRHLPAGLAHRLARAKHVLAMMGLYVAARGVPSLTGRILKILVARRLRGASSMDPHFSPAYPPWDQRLCVVADDDLFSAIRERRARVVTDRIRRFDQTGIELESGAHLDADVIVTATGLRLIPLGGIAITVDGRPVDPASTRMHRGLMLSGLPNLAWCIGYANASWGLRADVSSRHVVRVLDLLDRYGADYALPTLSEDASEGHVGRPIMHLRSGFIRRAMGTLPTQGGRYPWRLPQNYLLDMTLMRFDSMRRGLKLGLATGGD